jgi:alpha-D-ribose 1-methylphosphonate 5-triphosphate synthase subunit PhnL
MSEPLLSLVNVSKSFTLHNQNSAQLAVLHDVNLNLDAGECLVLDGPSGMGKSTLLKMIYANYRASSGSIWFRTTGQEALEINRATPRELMTLRRDGIGYVSQFLRVIPRVAALDVVAEPLLDDIASDDEAVSLARNKARRLLARLRIPERLWHLPPATFSGGEQQRINIARSLIKPRPLLLLDEPTASLDAESSRTVVELIMEAQARGSAVMGIFHDTKVAEALASWRLNIGQFRSVNLDRST